jgi:hypothetical protein
MKLNNNGCILGMGFLALGMREKAGQFEYYIIPF